MELKDITEEDVIGLAGSSVILARGADYYESKRIMSMKVEGGNILARVEGSQGIYNVKVSVKDGEISAKCNCPYEGFCCKHIVAVLYKWVNEKNKPAIRCESRNEIGLHKKLSNLSKEELIALILRFCEDYEDAKRDTILEVNRDGAIGSCGEELILKQVKDALYTRNGFIEYNSMFEVMGRLEKIEAAILATPPPTRSKLLEKMARICLQAYESCDDSSGSMGSLINECLEEYGKAVHEQNLPFDEKKKIIEENFALLENDEYGLDDGYISLLTELPSSKEEFHFLIEKLKLKISREKEEYEKETYKDMLTGLYKRAGMDTEYLQNLKADRDFLALAEYWKSKNDIERSIKAAEDGLRAEKENGDWISRSSLFGFLEDLYRNKNDKEGLLRTLMRHFKEAPSIQIYKEIIGISKGDKDLNKIKKQLIKQASGNNFIEICLYEGEVEKAYKKLMASPDNYPDALHDKVARKLIETNPAKSLKIYACIVDRALAVSNRDNYRIAALYAKKIREISIKINQKKEWEDYISIIRENNKRRPALIEELSRL